MATRLVYTLAGGNHSKKEDLDLLVVCPRSTLFQGVYMMYMPVKVEKANANAINQRGILEIDSSSSRLPRDQCTFELLPEIGADTDFDAETNAN